jgi:hypothetical protein
MQSKQFRIFATLLLLCVAWSSMAAEKTLTLVGKGTRTKKVFLFNVDVYECQFLVSDKPAFQSDLGKKVNPLDAVAKMDKAELRLKFLRNVSAAKIKDSFLDALEANKVNPKSANMAAFLKKIEDAPSFDEGKTVTLGADFKAGTLRFVDTKGIETLMQVGAQDVRNVFSIWLGNPADGGLETLKSALLGKKP